MEQLLAVEAEMGRVREVNRQGGGPDPGFRPIDLDLLLLGDEIHTGPGLLVPHPRLHERRFVLQPLVDVAPEALHPLLRRSARDLLEVCGDTAWVRRHAPPEAWFQAAAGAAR
jgi:2-amino-4-hydroxy-6-hydroxymethyldihydropteridine diphosphokinase